MSSGHLVVGTASAVYNYDQMSGGIGVGVIQMAARNPDEAAPHPPGNNLRWGNSKSKPTYGHTFLDHGESLRPTQLADRARSDGHQIGQFLDDQKAADFIGDIAQTRGSGSHDVTLPEVLPTRVVLPDGTEVPADMVRVVVKTDGSIRTSFPFSSTHPSR